MIGRDWERAILWEGICWRQTLELCDTTEAVCQSGAGTLPVVFEVLEFAGSRRDAGATEAIAPTPNWRDRNPQQVAAPNGTLTGVSQLWRSGREPVRIAKNSSCSALVIGPREPLPTLMRST